MALIQIAENGNNTVPSIQTALPPDHSLPSFPFHPDFHLFEAASEGHVFVVDKSRVYRVASPDYALLTAARQGTSRESADQVLHSLGLQSDHTIDNAPVADPPIRALSLAVAQKCNLGCSYCYAQEGEFGGTPKQMPLSVALAAVDQLFSQANSGDRVNLSFLGGEPLYARDVIRAATRRAAELGLERGVRTGFSITTNGTLINDEDAAFFELHGFAVSISLDGIGATHDAQRPFKGGAGTFSRIMERVKPLLILQRRMQVSARVTVTPQNLELRRTLDELLYFGFHSVGFSPMLSAPTGRGEMNPGDLAFMLCQMIECGLEFERQTLAGQRYAFANLTTALGEIYRGTHRPYPCGAGAGYLGVSADGDLSACHRFVNDENGAMGDLTSGIDRVRQNVWLAERHVHRQEPCRSCWARYLCGGGCHHEVIHRGRPSCDYIRGWLHYCLQAYARMLEQRPDYFTAA